ncbi:nitrile hydratase subunit alpha [Pseudonocardia acidicola]|uniref:nitrile hydratase n=1 Tax=Pseudonocardia acidicola TaxID=2724939 RepID=A0ABX1S6Z2_9PSEU|nr:nitrile hydratase subunit alpha [Pseudonocardia acidicola]NMH96577.1 nitrile hydratase subunit alpha [Pseudonocardia acidicola]
MTTGHHHGTPPAPVERRAAALEELLAEQGLVSPEYIDAVQQAYETQLGPMHGARVVARAWVDPAYRERLLANGTRAVHELGIQGPEIEHLTVVANGPEVHHVVVCTLCSCYPWAVLGLPPNWYKDPPYRARMVREPRTLLAEMGCPLHASVEIQVWDSSAESRYLVLPERPPGTEGLSEPELAALVTRDSMVGVAVL